MAAEPVEPRVRKELLRPLGLWTALRVLRLFLRRAWWSEDLPAPRSQLVGASGPVSGGPDLTPAAWWHGRADLPQPASVDDSGGVCRGPVGELASTVAITCLERNPQTGGGSWGCLRG